LKKASVPFGDRCGVPLDFRSLATSDTALKGIFGQFLNYPPGRRSTTAIRLSAKLKSSV